jgi:hypothetical protein
MGACLPVVVLVNGKGAADEAGSKNGCVEGNDLPHGGVVVGKDLELGIQVEVQEDEASKGSGGVTRWHGLQAVVNLLAVARADAAVKHDLAISIGNVAVDASLVAVVVLTKSETRWDDGLADSEEVRAETTNEPLDEDLEYSGGDERVQQTNGSIVHVPEAAGADLDNQKYSKGDEEGHQSGSPNGNDLCGDVSMRFIPRLYNAYHFAEDTQTLGTQSRRPGR